MASPAAANVEEWPQAAWAVLEPLTDPEIPVVTLRELGILRDVQWNSGVLEVVITPTYSGCPAMGQIEDDVRAALAPHGWPVKVITRLAPAWTTDWITDAAREKLRAYGIAPPGKTCTSDHNHVLRFVHDAALGSVACPRCGSTHTVESAHFGSTACKALYKCLDCQEPFDHFKPY